MYFPSFSSFLNLLACAVLLGVINRLPSMWRRISSQFGRKDKQTDSAPGDAVVDGTATPEKPAGTKTLSSFSQWKKSEQPEHVDHSVKREDVSSNFEKFAQLIHASARPLPNQTGDGTYLDDQKNVHSGIMADLKTLGFKDVKTLMGVMQNKASGALQDDKTYLMERVIQV